MTTNHRPLPMNLEECKQRGWHEVDIVLVTGDGYVDHPSFGVSLIGRLLEHNGFRVAILAQPRHDTALDFSRFGKPRLFFGITSGNLDSVVANYTSGGKVRDFDAYSQDGNPWYSKTQSRTTRRRPDRATIRYANLARSVFRHTPIILGGVEASLRRFIHFDYKQNHLRSSVLTDGKADLLIYGMGEKAILETAKSYDSGTSVCGIAGSCERLSDNQFQNFKIHLEEELVMLPSWHEIGNDPSKFMDAERSIDKNSRSRNPTILAQRQQAGWVVQHPPQPVLHSKELDAIYDIPFTRKPHPDAGDIPAYRMIRHSITTVRGCSGNCSFCAITRHQGPEITSRSIDSVVSEVKKVRDMDDFFGTISDLGGPTANLYGTSCSKEGCERYDCLYPKVCKFLQVNEKTFLSLLDRTISIDGVTHVHISSGLRMELLLNTPILLERIIRSHTPGAMKIAPEHTEKEQLVVMHKESQEILYKFVAACRKMAKKTGKNIHFTPYVITGHPGSTVRCAHELVSKMEQLGLQIRQFQDFTPTPGTISTAMHVSGLDHKGKPLHIPTQKEKMQQRSILERAFLKNKTKQKRRRK